MRTARSGAIVLSVLLSLGGWMAQPRVAGAQQRMLNGTTYADVELGFRFFADRPSDLAFGQLEQYRDLTTGLYFPALRGWFTSDDGRLKVDLRAKGAGQEDQRLGLRVRSSGRYSLELERDQSPHVFSTNSRFLPTSTEPGVFQLPTPRPELDAHNSAPFQDVGTRWTTDRLTLKVAPTADWAATAEYTRIQKRGERPLGLYMGGAAVEILEPVDQTVHHMRIMPSVRGERWQMQLRYDFSTFENDLPAVFVDNPLVATDGTGGAARPSIGLAPSNQAHRLTFQGGMSLPWSSRLGATFSYGLRQQSEPFRPHTTNTAINTSDLVGLPLELDGDVRTTMLNLTSSSRPLPSLALGLRYRWMDVDDRTPPVTLNGRVSVDRSKRMGEWVSHRYPYTRQSANADARLRVLPEVAVQLAYGWETWERDEHVREAARTSEHAPRLVVDVTPTDWLTLRTSYLRSTRRTDGYGHVVEAQFASLRKFDQADRDRERMDVTADFALLRGVDLGLSYAWGDNDYPDSRYGRTSDRNRASGIDLSWTFAERFTAYGSFLHESFRVRQGSRYRIGNQMDNATFDWRANTDDVVRTRGLGLTAAVMPRRLDVGIHWDRSSMLSQMRAENPLTPTGGTDAQNLSATATDFPKVRYTVNPASAFVSYRHDDNWSVHVRYVYDRFEQVDFRADDLVPHTGSDIFLANDPVDYRAQVMSLTFSYRPRLPGGARTPF